MLPPGKYSWYSPGIGLSTGALSLFNMLSAFGDLPHIPSTIMELQQALQGEDVGALELAKKIKGEPFVAANILSLANTIKSNRDPHDKRKISSLEHAIAFVGKRTISELVMTIALTSFKTRCKVFQTERFWRESFIVGDVAEYLCNALGYSMSRDELFIGASLCNLGKFVESFFLPDTVDRLEERVSNPKTLSTWQNAEAALGSPDHCVLGEIGATMWGLPTYVMEASLGHHSVKIDPSRASDKGLSQVELIAFANQMSHWVLLRPSRIDQNLLEKLRLFANLSKKDLEDLGDAMSPLTMRVS